MTELGLIATKQITSLGTILLVFCFTLFVKIQRAHGDLILAIDMDTVTPGVQSTRTTQASSSFDVDVILQLTGGSDVSGFSFGVDFGPSLMSVSGVSTTGRPVGFENVTSITVQNAIGRIRAFDAISLTSSISAPSTTLARLTVNANSQGVTTIVPGRQVNGVDDFLNGLGNLYVPGVNPGDGGFFFRSGQLTITAIPEPSSILMFGMTGLALAWRNRRHVRIPRR